MECCCLSSLIQKAANSARILRILAYKLLLFLFLDLSQYSRLVCVRGAVCVCGFLCVTLSLRNVVLLLHEMVSTL